MTQGQGTIAEVLAGKARWAIQCSDCLEVMPTLRDKSVAHVIADPPYTQHVCDNARSAPNGVNGSRLDEARAYIDFAGIDGLEGAITRACLRIAARWVILWSALEQIGAYREAAGAEWVRGTVWLRTNSCPQFSGDRPGQAVEAINIMHPRGRKRWNRGGQCWAPVGPTISSLSDPQRGTLGHPTPKPEWLMLETLKAFTDPDEVVLDPFCGSGTTGAACLRLGRRFIGIERDATWAALAVERLGAEAQGLTLRDVRAGQGTLFA